MTTETALKGRLLDFPPEWTPESPKWIEAFGFNLTAIPAGSEGAAITEMKSATARHEPLLVMFYEPHWAVGEYKLKAVDLPDFDPACVSDPKWGTNPERQMIVMRPARNHQGRVVGLRGQVAGGSQSDRENQIYQ